MTTTTTTTALMRAEPSPGAIDRLAFQPTSPEQVLQLVDKLVPTGMLPRHIKSPQAALLQVLYGREHGLTMMQSLMHMHVVGNVPAMSVELLAAKVRASPLCRRLAPTEITAERVVVVAERSDTGEQVTCEWTMADAQRAGLAQKDNWRHYPKRMLLARALGDAIQALFQDVKQGMAIAEELELVREDRAPALAAEETSPPPPPTSTAKLAERIRAMAPPAPPPEIIVDTVRVLDVPPTPAPEPAPAPIGSSGGDAAPAPAAAPSGREPDMTTEEHGALLAQIQALHARAGELLGEQRRDELWKRSDYRVEKVAGVRKRSTMLERVAQAKRLVQLAEIDLELRDARRDVMQELGEQEGRALIAKIAGGTDSAWKLGYDRASVVLSALLEALPPQAQATAQPGDDEGAL